MKKLIALFLVCIFILSGCADDSSSDSDTLRRKRRTNDSTTAVSITEPSAAGDISQHVYPNLGIRGEMIPEEVFTTTAEENGLSGTMCMVVGIVESFDVFEGTNFSYMWVDTITNGKIIVVDPVPALYEEAETSGWDVDKEKLRSLFPLPEVGEYAVIIAAYDGWSGKLECPIFVYGGTDYMVKSLLSATSAETIEQFDFEQPTTEQQKALDRAKEYLRAMPFSHEGLIDQLEYEGYTTADATYAADNCGADWNEQALKQAKSYLDTMAFSYSGLVDQLEYEGFTSEQATYGADNCNADWNEQAALKAESYMEIMTFTRSELISQLKYEGFTQEQAVYGADSVGL